MGSPFNREENAVPWGTSAASARWRGDDYAAYHFDAKEHLLLGWEQPNAAPPSRYLGYMDDRHLVTIAGSRAGKGVSCIIPALLDYRGSVFVLDPKGENATITADRRGDGTDGVHGLGQKVVVLDPFRKANVAGQYRATFNPLDWLGEDEDSAIYNAFTLADGFVLGNSNADSHWDESAKAVIQAVILHVKSWNGFTDKSRHLPHVRTLLNSGDTRAKSRIVKRLQRKLTKARLDLETAFDDELSKAEVKMLESDVADAEAALDAAERKHPFDYLISDMRSNKAFGGFISEWATGFQLVPPNERGSILSTAKRHTAFLAGKAMRDVLSSSSFDMSELRTNPNGLSIFLCLPAKYLGSHARWLRAMLGEALNRLEDMGTVDDKAPRVLFLLDEFAALGYMQILEKAAGLMAGYGVKFWFFLQDLSQLERHYKEGWETFLGNSGVLQVFGITDRKTADYVSARLGKIEISRQITTRSTSESSSQSSSQSKGTSSSSGWSSSSNRGFDPNLKKGEIYHGFLGSGFVETGTGEGKSGGSGSSSGTSSGTSTSSSSSTSTATNLSVANLLNPDEVILAVNRESKRQIVFIAGRLPMYLTRSEYFREFAYGGKDNVEPIPLGQQSTMILEHWAKRFGLTPRHDLGRRPDEPNFNEWNLKLRDAKLGDRPWWYPKRWWDNKAGKREKAFKATDEYQAAVADFYDQENAVKAWDKAEREHRERNERFWDYVNAMPCFFHEVEPDSEAHLALKEVMRKYGYSRDTPVVKLERQAFVREVYEELQEEKANP